MSPEIRVIFVQQGTVPSYGYTEGVRGRAGCELVCAGALRYDVYQVERILRACAEDLTRRPSHEAAMVEVAGLGTFAMGGVEPDWVEALLLGIPARRQQARWVQVIPVEPAPTLDTPDMARSLAEGHDPAWQWLVRPWDLPIPEESCVVTTLEVLTGSSPPVTIYRWEAGQWEALDKPAAELDRATARVAPFGLLTALVADWSLALSLGVGEGFQRLGSEWIRSR
ncbi:hypothetical protein [Sinomonas halotolerans]|uniref:Uncharacterized protein n=1 Tax=Sinomonas halotolerans TaxID=1644133 RepID=A0ABU9X0W2_9MICC